ncbi:hypothetical protein, partial [Phenylobacterium sp.]|uniref:hypothetical protein n=1 Tax=Phenylobacterium sp. TaxID=1871053 RepID=UPI0025E6192E
PEIAVITPPKLHHGLGHDHFLEALRLLQSLPNGPSDEAVHRAIANMHGRARLQNVIARLMRRSAAYPEHPLDADADFRPLRTASDLIRAGRRFAIACAIMSWVR